MQTRANYFSECHTECKNRVDCIQYYYSVDTTSEITVTHFYQLYIHQQLDQIVVYEISLKMSFEEYLSLTASIISLWFGFSIIAGTQTLRHILSKLKIYTIFNRFIIFNILLLFLVIRRFFKHLNN